MLAPRWRKVLRDLWQNKTRTALVVVSIAVGVFAFGVIAGARVMLLRDLHNTYIAIRPASATLTVDPFEQELVDTITRIPEVGAAQGRRTINARAKTGPDTWQDIQIIAVPDDPMSVAVVKPLSQIWPPPKKQLLVERDSLSKLAANIGDRVLIELPNGEQREIEVAGLAYDFSLPPPPIAAKAFVYVSLDTLEWLGQPRTFNQLQFIVAEQELNRDYIWQVADKVERKINDSGREVERTEVPTPQEHPSEQILPTVLMILGGLGVLSLIMSGFLIINTISAILTQQTRQIGVMKAIGAGTGQITQLYLSMSLIFGLLALLLAVPLGAFGAYAFSHYMANWLNFDIIRWAPTAQVVAMEIAAGLLTPALSGIYPILSAARKSVREAISSTGIEATGMHQGFLEGLVGRIPGLSRPLLLSIRNTFRRKGRLVRTLIALILAGGIFISVLTVRQSLFLTLDNSFDARHYQIVVTFAQPYRAERLNQEALRVPGVTDAETWDSANAQPVHADGSLGDPMNVFALPPTTNMFAPEIMEGRWLLPDDENAVVVSTNFVTKKEPGVRIGDTITVRIDEEDYHWRIVGTVRETIAPVAPAVAYVPRDYFARTAGKAGKGDSLRVALAHPDNNGQRETLALLDTHLTAQNLRISSIKTNAADRASLGERVNLITTMLGLMAILVGVVGGLGLMGTMSINVLERTREIGVMRAVGASNSAVQQIVIVEGVLIGLIAWLAGALLSLPMSTLMCNRIGLSLLNMPLHYSYASYGLLIWFVAATLVAALASLVPARRAASLTIREVLAYE